MANIPVPRSYAQILGDMIDIVSVRTGIRNLTVGDPLLSILEAAAHSDLRSSQDIFTMLNSISLENATSEALDRIGNSENVFRIPATQAFGDVTISDSRFTKIATTIYAGTVPVLAGVSGVNISSTAGFPASGSVYIGRGTINYEGPLAYSSITNNGNYFTLNLTSSTSRFHNVLETVILAQGGDRIVNNNTTVQTSQGASAQPVTFNTLASATILDGEVEVDNIPVLAANSGTSGNIVAGAINKIAGNPFPGALVSNPLPITNGLDLQDDLSYRESIRTARQTKSKGTALALTSSAIGIFAQDEHKRVQSASLVNIDVPTLYIDDGTGYEEQSQGVGLESIVNLASGGEQYFQLTGGLPVTKASVKTSLMSPFLLVDGAILAIQVDTQLFNHTFDSTDFININNATSFEVASSINKDGTFPFVAKVTDSGSTVTISLKTEVNEDFQVTQPISGIDANAYLGFPTSIVYTLKLYKNNKLLYKDGVSARIFSSPQSVWATTIGLSGSETFVIQVDNTPIQTITITNSDFINNNTGYSTISRNNSLTAWATVLTAKIAGATASVSNNQLVIISNLGISSNASIKVIDVAGSNTLFTKNMFSTVYSASTISGTTTTLYDNGISNDYSFDRNTGQIKLSSPLIVNDILSAGSLNTNGYIQGANLSNNLVIGATTANLWVAIDGNTTILPTAVSGTTTYTIDQSPDGDPLVRITLNQTHVINGYVNPGDWVVIWDPNLLQHGLTANAYKISTVVSTGGFGNDYIEVEFNLPGGFAPFTASLANNGLVFVRTSVQLQLITVPALTSGLTAILNSINSQLNGATATIQLDNQIRIATNSYSSDGNISIVAADISAQALQLPISTGLSQPPHLAFLESVNGYIGNPLFYNNILDTADNANNNIYNFDPYVSGGTALVWERPLPDRVSRWGTNTTDAQTTSSFSYSYVDTITETIFNATTTTFIVSDTTNLNVTDYVSVKFPTPNGVIVSGQYLVASKTATSIVCNFRNPSSGISFVVGKVYVSKVNLRSDNTSPAQLVTGDRYRYSSNYAIGPRDDLSLIIDNNALSQNYSIPMYRRVQATDSTYTGTVNLIDLDNNGLALWSAFGNGFNFNDYAFYMKARAITHPYDATKTALWRYNRFGPEGNIIVLSYNYPDSASQPLTLSWTNDNTTNVSLKLASSAARANPGLTNDSALSVRGTAATSSNSLTYCAGFNIPAGNITSAGGGANVLISLSAPTNIGLPPNFTDINQILNTSTTYVYLTGADVTLPSGVYKVITLNSSISFTISATVAGGAYTSAGAYNICITQNPSAASINSNFTGLTVNDIVHIGSGASFSLGGHENVSYRITAKNIGYFTVMAPQSASNTGENTIPINNISNISFYPLNASLNIVSNIVSTLSNSIITGTIAPGTGTGVVSLSTSDEYGNDNTKPQNYPFSGGINFVSSSNITSVGNHSQVTLKIDPTILESTVSGGNTLFFGSGTVQTNGTAEEIHIAPITGKNVVSFLSSPAISGIYANAKLANSSNYSKVQIATKTPGSSGAVQISGGSSNIAEASVVGMATNNSNSCTVTIASSLDKGFNGSKLVSIHSILPQPKIVTALSDSTQTITIANVSANIYSLTAQSTTTFGTTLSSAATASWMVEQQRDFAFYRQLTVNTHFHTIATLTEGINVYISSTSAFSDQNQGTFRVVRIIDEGFWVENPNSKTEVVTTLSSAEVVFTTYDSVLPGDILKVNNNVFGTANIGNFTVTEFALPTSASTNYYSIKVQGALTPVSSTSLSGFTQGLQVQEATPRKLFKRITGVFPNSQDSINYTDLTLNTNAYSSQINAASGTVISALDKLDFPLEIAQGIDAYSYNTGLTAEVNKVIYGDSNDTATYPGVIAAGTNLNISGPLIHRVQISLGIRTNSTNDNTISNRVKSAVAGVVNKTGVGESIAISSIISAAEFIDGVVAVSIISPEFNSNNDLINIQPFEKPLILDLDNDISVSFIGN